MTYRHSLLPPLASTLVIAFLPGLLSAAVTFTKVIAQGDPFPGDAGHMAVNIGSPVLDQASAGGVMLLRLGAGFDPGSFTALYLVNGAGQFQRVVSTETPKPGGGTFTDLGPATVYGSTVYFVGFLGFLGDGGQMICKVEQPGGPITVIASKGDVVTGADTYDAFVSVSADAAGVVIDANIRRSDFVYYRDLMFYGGDSLVSLVGYGITPVPGAAGSVFYVGDTFDPAILRDGEVLFFGQGQPFRQGFYTLPVPGSSKPPRVIVDNTTQVPGLGTGFTFPNILGAHPADLDAGEVVFYGNSSGNTARGLYRATVDNGIVANVTTNTPVPGGVGNFNQDSLATRSFAYAAGRLVFVASDENYTQGLFVHDGQSIERILTTEDVIDGVLVSSIEMGPNSLVGNQLAIQTGGAVWRATLGSSGPQLVLHITGAAGGVEVSWDGAAAGSGAVLEGTPSLTSPDWRPVTNPSNPFVESIEPGIRRFFRLKL